METEAVVQEHVKKMGLPESTGRHILDAVAMVEEYLKNQKEIARISTEAEASEEAVKSEMRELKDEFYRRERELDDEKNRRHAVLNNKLKTVEAETKGTLNPLWEQMNGVKRIIALLRIAETIQPVLDIEDGDITTHHGEYLEWLEHIYKDDFLKIRLLITENRKPKNRYSLLAYGRCAFEDQKLLKRVYAYGTPNLNEHSEIFSMRHELGCFPSVEEIKRLVSKYPDRVLRTYIAEFEALKKEYLEVTGRYKLSDFEQITAQEKAKGVSQ